MGPTMFFVFLLILTAIFLFLKDSSKTSRHRSRGRTPRPRRSSDYIGSEGERIVGRIIGSTIPGVQYVINNLILRIEENKTSQIDHVVINKHGVFVIETKNYAGMIYGSENQLEWTQVLNYGKVKNHFYNPLKQNKTHIYHISKILSDYITIIPMVVFVSSDISNVESPDVYSSQEIKHALSRGAETLTAEQMEKAYNELLAAHCSDISMEEHISNIHEMQSKIDNNICPRCGAPLVLRKSKNGDFYGCSSYPKCSFTKKA